MSANPALLLAFLLTVPATALAGRTVVLSGDPVPIRLALRQPTAVTLPEPIAAVPTGADPQQLSLELDGARLFLQPLEPTVTGLLFAIGVSGRSYALRFAVGTPADTEVLVTLPSPAPAQFPGSATATAEGSWRPLLRAMLQGSPLPGVTATPLSQALGEVDGFRLTAVRVYRRGSLRGYVAEAVNPTDTARPLRVSAFTAPGLLAISATLEQVPARGATRLYFVLQASTP